MNKETDPKVRCPEQDERPPRQVTVQPQEPAPWKGGPPKQPQQPGQGPRPAPAGAKDQRSGRDRDGNG
jgi:hypothetical protein